MAKLLHGEITEQVLGAAFRVHSTLGPGFLESIYERAMAMELTKRQVPFERQVQVPIFYDGEKIGSHTLDMLVDGKMVVELKAVRELADVHYSTVQAYLTATGLSVGLLLNFNASSLFYKRVINKVLGPA